MLFTRDGRWVANREAIDAVGAGDLRAARKRGEVDVALRNNDKPVRVIIQSSKKRFARELRESTRIGAVSESIPSFK